MDSPDYARLTFTISLPRCRTKWLTQLMKPWAYTEHEPMMRYRSVEEYGEYIDLVLGDRPTNVLMADTLAVLFFDQLVERFPGARFLFIAREPHEVIASLKKLDAGFANKSRGIAMEAEIMETSRLFDVAMQSAYVNESIDSARVHASGLSSFSVVHRIIHFIVDPRPSAAYIRNMIDTPIVADYERIKRDMDIGTIRALFATRTGADG
jgi:hypothetical protein